MKHHNMLPYRAWMAATLLAVRVSADQTYCSSQNTGADNSQGTDIYMSNGLCSDHCRSEYAFAIVSYQSCYCSNYIPADQESTSNCSQDCPGYPAEQCGDENSGLFGYISLSLQPSGTAGAGGASSTQRPSSTAQSTTEEPKTSYVSTTSIVVSVTRPTTSTTSNRASATSTSETSTSVTPTTVGSATPVTSVLMTTISGAVVTQTVTSTPIIADGAHDDQAPIQRSDGLGGGAIAGIVIGVLVAIALIAAIAFLLWRRKRNDDNERQGGSVAGSKKSMTRNVSVLSKAGLLSRNNTRPSMGERDHDDGQYITSVNGQNSVRHSMLFAGNDGVSPVSPLDSSHSGGSRRLSKPMVYDQRLNPSVLFANQEANGSRVSMQDTQDYSRPLGVMNPDPRPSFESRMSRA